MSALLVIGYVLMSLWAVRAVQRQMGDGWAGVTAIVAIVAGLGVAS